MRKLLVVLSLSGMLAACDEEGVHAYRAPKPPPPAAKPQPTADKRVTWTIPQGWESIPSTQEMRLATFRTGPGSPDVSLTSFPGDSGGLLANLNRWRGQLGLQPIDESQLPAALEVFTIEGVKVALADLVGANNQEMLGAIIIPGDGKTWFVKATGAPDAIATLKPVFAAFARSFRLQAVPLTSAAEVSATKSEVQSRLTAWTPPPNWRPDPNASTMVAAAFDATNPDGNAKITATVLVSTGGGPLANINRWRDQLGLPPVAKLDQQPITDLGSGNLMVDLASADGSKRMMAAIVSSGTQTWFFKIIGPPKGVESERPTFESLIRTVGLGVPTP